MKCSTPCQCGRGCQHSARGFPRAVLPTDTSQPSYPWAPFCSLIFSAALLPPASFLPAPFVLLPMPFMLPSIFLSLGCFPPASFPLSLPPDTVAPLLPCPAALCHVSRAQLGSPCPPIHCQRGTKLLSFTNTNNLATKYCQVTLENEDKPTGGQPLQALA